MEHQESLSILKSCRQWDGSPTSGLNGELVTSIRNGNNPAGWWNRFVPLNNLMLLSNKKENRPVTRGRFHIAIYAG
jgi:hypothetical protein